MNEKKRITVKDIALLAGVSKGTVDRVIHNRGEVSESSRQKVLKVAEQLGYKPNVYASLLASQKNYIMACLIPSFRPDEYWSQVAGGLQAAQQKASPFHITVELLTYDLFSVDSFRSQFERLLSLNPDMVVLAPTFQDASREFMTLLDEKNIPCLLIDSYLPDADYLAYFGMPMFESGYLAAQLLFGRQEVEQVAVFRIHKDRQLINNSANWRYDGFMQYIKDRGYRTQVVDEYIDPYDTQYNRQVFERFFSRYPHIRHLITFNSRVHLVANFISHARMEADTTLVGFDHLPQNLEGLKAGSIQFLITQHTETLLSHCVDAMANYLFYRQSPGVQNNYLPMDILTRYNADFYQTVF